MGPELESCVLFFPINCIFGFLFAHRFLSGLICSLLFLVVSWT